MSPNTIIILDLGHGGLDANGIYTTAPDKMFTFPDGTVAYEGVYNREIGRRVGMLLEQEGVKTVFTVLPTNSKDVTLYDRVKLENMLHGAGYETLFISFHSNAGKGQGFELFTSIGQTKSDLLSDSIGEQIQCEFPNLKFRADYIDGDLDKEAGFYVCKNTKGAAVLLENLFFDNRDDFELLRSDLFQKRLSKAITAGIINYIQTQC